MASRLPPRLARSVGLYRSPTLSTALHFQIPLPSLISAHLNLQSIIARAQRRGNAQAVALKESEEFDHDGSEILPDHLDSQRFGSIQEIRLPSTYSTIAREAALLARVAPRKPLEALHADSTYHPALQREGSRDPYWQKVPQWRDVSEREFMDKKWQAAHVVRDKAKLLKFLSLALPERLNSKVGSPFEHIHTREDFMRDVLDGIDMAPMAIRLTPHILSVINWENGLEDPIRKQFIPMKASALPDHSMLTLDSLHEEEDSPVKGLVHRYPDKALFLATSICPLYCRFCTRSYAVGLDTDLVSKKTLKPTKQRWEDMFAYIESTPSLHDIVVSGGDSYLLTPSQILEIGTRLISIPHIRRFRFASKGLAVMPSRILDETDEWAEALIEVSRLARREGKAVALHTHFNHPAEITWMTKMAARKLFEAGVTVRNQSVLLRGVNDEAGTMSTLIRRLADINIQPYYVYQADMVRGVEDLRTPLQTCLDLETQIRGSIAGFMMPQFVVDLPGGGGKRLAASYLSYDRETGVSKFVAPAVTRDTRKVDMVYEYHDPTWSLGGGKGLSR